MSEIECPFCGDTDFDLIGLKHHLNNYCNAYQKVKVLEGVKCTEEKEQQSDEKD